MSATVDTVDQPLAGSMFINRLVNVATPYVTNLKPYVSKAADAINRNGQLDGTYEKIGEYSEFTVSKTYEKIEELTAITRENMPKTVSEVITANTPRVESFITQLDEFGCDQLDRIETLRSQSNLTLNKTYEWYKGQTDYVKEQIEVTNTVVKQQLNTTVDVLLPEEASKDSEDIEGDGEASPLTFTDIGSKVLGRSRPIVTSQLIKAKDFVVERVPIVETIASSYYQKAGELHQRFTDLSVSTKDFRESVPLSTESVIRLRKTLVMVEPPTFVREALRASVDRGQEYLPSVLATIGINTPPEKLFEQWTITSAKVYGNMEFLLKEKAAYFYLNMFAHSSPPSPVVSAPSAHASAPSTPPAPATSPVADVSMHLEENEASPVTEDENEEFDDAE